MRILVVDDESSLLLTLSANLELEGFEVAGAESAARALELLGEQPFDLVLTDIRMPGMNGVELFRRARALYPDLPVVLMTGFAMEGLISDAIRSGAFAVLTKPFEIEHMLAALTRAGGRPMVLVVDDARDEALTTEEVLRTMGVRAKAVFDAEGAVEALRQGQIDVCILDLVMPGVSGPDLLDRIRALDSSIAFIAVSGHDVPEMMERAASRGAFACLQKPFDPGELAETIARVRGRRP